MNANVADFLHATTATVGRECLSHRVNRFLYGHLALLATAGVAAVLVAPEDEERGVAWFLLYAVMYAISLSAVLLGLSSAQAEREEAAFLHTQPSGIRPWVIGKAVGLAALVMPSALLLVVPWWVAGGWSSTLLGLAAGAAGVCLVLAWLGLAVGLWIREPVRGLITAVACWFALLFATDLLLLLVAGSPWVQAHPAVWVATLMANPLDAFRVSVLFSVERAVFNTLGAGTLVTWWTQHPVLWLASCLFAWAAGMLALALRAARAPFD